MGGGDGDDLIGAREALHGLEVSDEAFEEWSESTECCNWRTSSIILSIKEKINNKKDFVLCLNQRLR